jgi:monothiol glutaredoxin
METPQIVAYLKTQSGQPLSPCIEINGVMLADISGEEVEQYLVENHLIQASSSPTEVPIDAPCPPEQHEAANVSFHR